MKIFLIVMLVFIAFELACIYDEIKKGSDEDDT